MVSKPHMHDGLMNLETVRGLDVNLQRAVEDARIGEDAAFDEQLQRRRSVVDDLVTWTAETWREYHVQTEYKDRKIQCFGPRPLLPYN